MKNKVEFLSIIVLGASGDLAKRKIYPALFTLFNQGFLRGNFKIIGFSRSTLSSTDFHNQISAYLKSKSQFENELKKSVEKFLSHCDYVSGKYDSKKDFVVLNDYLKESEKNSVKANRIFYFAIPPNVFIDVSVSIGENAMSKKGWTRVIIEKPFGRDTESSYSLNKELKKIFKEEQIYRIDHYLGKELVQNLMVLRFANLIFEPIWNHNYIHSIQINWKENLTLTGRGGYFDQYGIIRDVMQNHLMQILSLISMEEPVSLEAEDIRDEKVKVLKKIDPLDLKDVVFGQYISKDKDKSLGYLEENDVPNNSITPTYGATVLFIKNRRWDGVPFFLVSGKALRDTKTEIKINFKKIPGKLFDIKGREMPSNKLVIRVQPNESIHFDIMNKIPGLELKMEQSRLNLQYHSAFNEEIPDAYERLILDVVKGDKSLFIRDDELDAAWKIFTSMLHEMESNNIRPENYEIGTDGPAEANYLAAKHGIRID